MESIAQKQNRLLNFKTEFQNFIYSIYFPLEVALFTVFIYLSGMQLAGILAFSLMAMFIFMVQEDFTPILPLLFFATFLLSDTTKFSNPLVFLLFLPVVIGLIFHFIKYPVKKFKFSLYGLSLIVMLISYLLGGILTGEYAEYFNAKGEWFGGGLAQLLGLGVGLIAEYFLLKLYIYPKKDRFDLKNYVSVTMLSAGLTVALELIAMRICGLPRDFGWGNINFAGYVFLLSLPSAIYLLIKTKKVVLYFIVILCIFGVILLCKSDGALFISLLYSPFMIYYTAKNLPNKQKQLFLNLCYCVILCALLFILALLIYDGDGFMAKLQKSLGDTGRSTLLEQAIQAFKENPIFGKSIFHPFKNKLFIDANHDLMVNYHSSIFHTLATTGIFGLLALIFNYFTRYRIITKRYTPFNMCIFFTVSLYATYASIDCGETMMLLIFVTGLLTVTEKTNDMPKTDLPLNK